MSEEDIQLLIEDEYEFFQKGKENARQLDEAAARRKLVDASKECLTPECDA
jgi:hypothetical protein